MSKKIAFLFPGQGAQYIDMGKDLYENIESCKNIFDKGEEILDMPIKDLIFNGSIEELTRTKNSQPAIMLTSLACQKALEESGVEADYALGLSLGEYGALVYGGMLSFEDGMKLIKTRAQIMDSEVSPEEGTMAAVLKLDNFKVEELIKRASESGLVEGANYNCPGQVVISGEHKAIKASIKIGKELKGMVLPLKVSGPFHSSIYEKASYKFYEELKKVNINKFEKTVYSNVKGSPYEESDDVKELLRQQIMSSVLFEKSIRNLIDRGVNTFVEVGPGKTLSGFVKKINKDVKIHNVEDLKSLRETVESLKLEKINA
ncbi:ACP S-malonyltransferase [Terrisporobacter glycolicus]|uniref:Malonyl CoA-acyl carrier protein transacylase n=1 Tax=Terrisporobacter glycolicus ATCC 14880 = DSM 1288 TaxID=1121315 RepID=A0ABZ2EQP3_9FIRM|nr:ACP S-malonyltransferase [Terrisporobacter glycolicus]